MYFSLNRSHQVNIMTLARRHSFYFLNSWAQNRFLVVAHWSPWSEWSECQSFFINPRVKISERRRGCKCHNCTIYCRIVLVKFSSKIIKISFIELDKNIKVGEPRWNENFVQMRKPVVQKDSVSPQHRDLRHGHVNLLKSSI